MVAKSILQTSWQMLCLACGKEWTVTTNGGADRTANLHFRECEGSKE